MNCYRLIEDKSSAWQTYNSCLNKAKYRVSYNEPLRGRPITETLCGVHFRALEKQAKKIDIELNVESL